MVRKLKTNIEPQGISAEYIEPIKVEKCPICNFNYERVVGVTGYATWVMSENLYDNRVVIFVHPNSHDGKKEIESDYLSISRIFRGGCSVYTMNINNHYYGRIILPYMFSSERTLDAIRRKINNIKKEY